jgi:four helix bundle protein
MMDVVQALEKKRVYRRVIDQVVGAGTSVGANACEADQALSRADFAKSLGIVVKELAESQFWLRVCVRRGWLHATRLQELQSEAEVLSKVFSTMIVRSRG